jgi:hypothetical protein
MLSLFRISGCSVIALFVVCGSAGVSEETLISRLKDENRREEREHDLPAGDTDELHGMKSFTVHDLLTGAGAFPSGVKRDQNYLLQKVEEWRKAALSHQPGAEDDAVTTIGGWNHLDIEMVIEFVTNLSSRSNRSARRTISRAPIRSRLGLTDEEVQQGDLNRVVKQGAMLHTDIAVLQLGRGASRLKGSYMGAFVDGRLFYKPENLHWNYARTLIDAVSPSPSRDPIARQWYLATTAHLLSLRHLAYARRNIENALNFFPADHAFLLYAGSLHEAWAMPMNQNLQMPQTTATSTRRLKWDIENARQLLSPPGVKVEYGSMESELRKARNYYRDAVKIDPGCAESRLRHGRVIGLLGFHSQALEELKKASAGVIDPLLSYYALIYLGREYEMLTLPDEAKEQYRRAAALFPAAQSPLLSLSHLARKSDDAAAALEALRRVFALHENNTGGESDPLLEYDVAHVRNASVLLDEMRSMFGEIPR